LYKLYLKVTLDMGGCGMRFNLLHLPFKPWLSILNLILVVT